MADWIDDELTHSYTSATKAGEARLATQPRAAKAYFDVRKARLVIELTNGVILMLPPKLLQGLKRATPAQLARVQLTALGISGRGSQRSRSRGWDLRIEDLDERIGAPRGIENIRAQGIQFARKR